MLAPFSESDLAEYLKIELYHSLEKHRIQDDILNYLEKDKEIKNNRNLANNFFNILIDFYSCLPKLRYLMDIIEGHPHHQYNKANYIESAKQKYKKLVNKIDKLIHQLFLNVWGKEREHKWKIDNITIADIENHFIYYFYDMIRSNIDLHNKISNYDIYIKRIKKYKLKLSIVKRFVGDVATRSEKYDAECTERIFSNKQQRYSGEDRAGYWGERVKPENTVLRKIRREAEDLLAGNERRDLVVGFLILILTKYHIILHQHAGNEFRYLQQHTDRASSSNEEIIRAQKVFTFTRLIGKYFPHIFNNDQTKPKATAKVIEIVSYLRRGFAFEVLGAPDKAFNDYSSAEKQASLLCGNEFNKIKDNFVELYQKLTVPYIYSLKGELYRRNFAFYNAHQYFCNSISRFDENYDQNKGDIQDLLNFSLKKGRIQIFKGKTFFELGEFRKALKWHLKALKQLLSALKLKYNDGKFDAAITYLGEKRLEPKINKREISDKLNALTSEINNIYKQYRDQFINYAVLLSELFNRISLIIYILNLPNYGTPDYKKFKKEYEQKQKLAEREKIKDNLCRNSLAQEWLDLAKELNPESCLARLNELIYCLDSHGNEYKLHSLTKMLAGKMSEEVISLVDSLTLGEPRDIIYRLMSLYTMVALAKMKPDNPKKEIAKNLFQKFLIYTDDFSTRNAELYKYLMKPRKLKEPSNESAKDTGSEIQFHFLRRWSSINPAVPRPSAFKMKGGGYFLIFKGRGIAIDPGLNFVENLYSEGFSIADVDYIITTHDHIDHIAEIDTIMSIHYRRYNKLDKDKKLDKKLTLILNPSVSARYGFLINQNPKLFGKMELTPDGNRREIFPGFAIEANQVEHLDICSPKYSNSIGLVLFFSLNDGENEFRIGITGDTYYWKKNDDGYYSDKPVFDDHFLESDIIIAHINSASFRELKAICGIGLDDTLKNQLIKIDDNLKSERNKIQCKIDTDKKFGKDTTALEDRLKIIEGMQDAINQVKYSLGYNIGQTFSEICNNVTKLNDEQRDLDGEHMFLDGIIETYKRFIEISKNFPDKQKLYIIAETSEEMGSYRHKVAMRLNKHIKKSDGGNGPKCLTGDIGLTVRIKPSGKQKKTKIQIRCSRCNLNNDYTDNDKFHRLENINEVCLKWEEEGLFYFCRRHDPESGNREFEDYGFSERIERYQPLRHVEIRVS